MAGRKKLILFTVLAVTAILASGCASMPAQGPGAQIILTTADSARPYKELGVISLVGTRMRTTRDELNEKMRQRARELGADAVIKVEYGVETKTVIVPGAFVQYEPREESFDYPSCKGTAVIFLDKK